MDNHCNERLCTTGFGEASNELGSENGSNTNPAENVERSSQGSIIGSRGDVGILGILESTTAMPADKEPDQNFVDDDGHVGSLPSESAQDASRVSPSSTTVSVPSASVAKKFKRSGSESGSASTSTTSVPSEHGHVGPLPSESAQDAPIFSVSSTTVSVPSASIATRFERSGLESGSASTLTTSGPSEDGHVGSLPSESAQDAPRDSLSSTVSVRQTSLEDLPPVLMVMIFGYLPLNERVPIGRVSKRWQDYVNVSLRSETHLPQDFWNHFDFRFSYWSYWLLELYTELLDRMRVPGTMGTQVQTIDLKGTRAQLLDHFPQLSPQDFPQLRTLMADFPRSPRSIAEDYFSKLLLFKNLRRLELQISDGPPINSLFRRIIDEIPNLTHLKVEISAVRDIDINYVNDLLEGCVAGAGHSIQSLAVNPLPGDGFQTLIETFSNVTELCLLHWDACPRELEVNIQPITQLKLKSLDLIEMRTASHLTGAYNALPCLWRSPLAESLEVLKLGMEVHSIKNLRQFLDPVAIGRALKVLRLDHVAYRDPDLAFLTVRDFPKLEDLRLWNVSRHSNFDLPQLRRLSYHTYSERPSDVLWFLDIVLPKCQSLEFLELPEFGIRDCPSLLPLLEKSWSGDRRFLDVKVDKSIASDLSLFQSWNQTAATKGLCVRVSFF